MADIQVTKKSDTSYEVRVAAETTTTHAVTVTAEDYERLSRGKVSPEELIEKSFEFLLEREPNTAILSRFELPIIGRYFPEYERSIVDRL